MDQFTTLLFETLNSRNERQIKNVAEDAYNGSVSKDVYVNTIMRLEFAQMINTRALLIPLHFSKREIKESRDYKILMACPLDFNGFLAYLKTIPNTPDNVKYYEDEYDELRKMNSSAKTEDKPKSEPEHYPPENSTPTPPARP